MTKRVVLAYSGGLDTSVAVRWLGEELGVEVIALAADVGQGGDWDQIRDRALAAGAVEAIVDDCRDEYAEHYVAPALKANAKYEGKYPLVSSPATVPSTSARPARSMADPTTWAEPGGVRSTTRLPEWATSTTHSPNTRFSCSSGAGRSSNWGTA